MTKEDILKGAKEMKNTYPQWRWGQAVFNWCDINTKVARDVQFKDGVDCFYDDEMIDKFIHKVLERL